MTYIISPQTEQLKSAITNHRVINIYGNAGSGKTTLYKQCLEKHFADAPAMIISSYLIDQSFNGQLLHEYMRDYIIHGGICILEDFSYVSYPRSILDYITSIPNHRIKFIIETREKINHDSVFAFEVNPLQYAQILNFIRKSLNQHIQHLDRINPDILRRISSIANSDLSLANGFVDILEDNPSLLTAETNILYTPCIVDTSGNTIDSTSNTIKIVTSEVNDQLLYELSQNPNLLYNLSPYDFERVIAKIFEKKGFSVKITPKTRDGGKDIFVAKNDLMSFLFYVECKKYNPEHPVGIDVIQRLYGVVSAEKATGGVVATTSRFTKSATTYIQEHKLENQLTLHDYDAITKILQDIQK